MRTRGCCRKRLAWSGYVFDAEGGQAVVISTSTNVHPSPWLTPAQLADYLGVALGTVRNWTSARYVPYCRRGRVVRYHRDDIDRWLARGGCPGRATIADTVK